MSFKDNKHLLCIYILVYVSVLHKIYDFHTKNLQKTQSEIVASQAAHTTEGRNKYLKKKQQLETPPTQASVGEAIDSFPHEYNYQNHDRISLKRSEIVNFFYNQNLTMWI